MECGWLFQGDGQLDGLLTLSIAEDYCILCVWFLFLKVTHCSGQEKNTTFLKDGFCEAIAKVPKFKTNVIWSSMKIRISVEKVCEKSLTF